MIILESKRPSPDMTDEETYYDTCFPDCGGDILYGVKYIDSMTPNDFAEEPLDIILLHFCAYNTFAALAILGCGNAHEVFRSVTYQCPWSKNEYVWFAPVAIIIKDGDEKKYEKLPKYATTVLQKSAKGPFKMSPNDLLWNNQIIDAMMGHGYTVGTNPDDGMNRKNSVIIQLSNGDELIVRCWVWYNK